MNGPLTAVAGRCTSALSPRSVNWRGAAGTPRAGRHARPPEEVSARHLPPRRACGRPLLNGERSRLLRAVEVAAERVGARLVDLAYKLARLAGLNRGLFGRQVVLRVVLPVRPRHAPAVDELAFVLDVDTELLAGADLEFARLEAVVARHDIKRHVDGLLGAGRRRRRRFLRHRLPPDPAG